ncbi:MAG: paraquat-inducible protein A [Candidatus Magnetoglobus multicellularis str. Araruama]|uniref:Paraquat-inducible protein A n=1 Tax=Candidatus Magnetoglobus multicellularis str. Araruama TaxID=890399 RepID=A0A1V1NVK1_9BACT|nr:MAG: paraquat-inducible protein A [Candidatus Magnetoglobus multicellularis str. Araruama]
MLHSQSRNSRLLLIRWLMFLSLLLLIIGILSPFLRIVVAKEIKLFGPFVFEYNTKSIATTIRHLSSTNVFLCLLILICSIIIPVFKVVLTYLSTHSSSNGVRTRSEFILKIIGKWAMTDVFVVAILLTFLSMDGKNSAQCDLDFGFYFLLHIVYCLFAVFFDKKSA